MNGSNEKRIKRQSDLLMISPTRGILIWAELLNYLSDYWVRESTGMLDVNPETPAYDVKNPPLTSLSLSYVHPERNPMTTSPYSTSGNSVSREPFLSSTQILGQFRRRKLMLVLWDLLSLSLWSRGNSVPVGTWVASGDLITIITLWFIGPYLWQDIGF